MTPARNLLTQLIAHRLLAQGETLATAESCTAGGIAAALCAEPGASQWFRGSIVAYTEPIKETLLGVPEEVIHDYGVVSREVAEAMAKGALCRLGADYVIASTGAAGPKAPDKQTRVGTVWLAVASRTDVSAVELHLSGSRKGITDAAIQESLRACYRRLCNNNNNRNI